jgi:hypothetical protein
MALPASGQIDVGQVSVELGRTSTATTSMGESVSRYLAGVPTGAISMSSFYGDSITPNAVDWTNITGDTFVYGNFQSINGITQNITLTIASTNMSVTGTADNQFNGDMEIQVMVNGSYVNSLTGSGGGPSSGSFNTSVSSGANIQFIAIVNVSDTLGGSASGAGTATVTINNATKIGTPQLDSFTVNVTNSV